MKVVIPFTPVKYSLEAQEAHRAIPGAEWSDVSADVQAYHRLFSDLWLAGETFLLIEHDIVPNDEAMIQAEECSCWWGTSPYEGPPGRGLLTDSLGFVCFRAELMMAEPDLATEAWWDPEGGKTFAPGHWKRMDLRIAHQLRERGYEPHVHDATVAHLHYSARTDTSHSTAARDMLRADRIA